MDRKIVSNCLNLPTLVNYTQLKPVSDYLDKITSEEKLPNDFSNRIQKWLQELRVINCDFLLDINNLWLRDHGDQIWRCPNCRKLHLHPAGGVCTNCLDILASPEPYQKSNNQLDYYGYLASEEAGKPFRLHCEELTGQTNKSEAQKRQRWFQDMILEDEIKQVDEIDLLSVTTTMEAGIDIGRLEAIMMGNMPPQRFNYQQRVGRAGRRGKGIAVAITFCRGRSHDDYYFLRPTKIVSDPTKSPYIDLKQLDILKRMFFKEILRNAFDNSFLYSGDEKYHSVHGEFGRIDNWSKKREELSDWISQNEEYINKTLDCLLHYTDQDLQERRNQLIAEVSKIVDVIDQETKGDHSGYEFLSEFLANKGILPMYGFPTRTRFLLHEEPPQWPPKAGFVDRDIDIAISQFAPGSETIKDKLIYTSVGVATFKRKWNRTEVSEKAFAYELEIGKCKKCQSLTKQPEDNCKVCKCSDNDYQKISIKEPLGFITEFGEKRDYDGQFDFTPRASMAQLEAMRPFNTDLVTGLNISCGTESQSSDKADVYTINDNGGNLFEFSKATRGKLKGAYLVKNCLKNINYDFSNDEPEKIALASIKKTDVLIAHINKWPDGVKVDTKNVYGRAALYSFGFLLRKAVAAYLDIDEKEISVGIRLFENTPQIFLCDTLENGAGYCNYLGDPKEFKKFMESEIVRELLESFRNDSHAAKCDSSCYDCLRDYANMAYHSLLDWRLGLELFELALNTKYSFEDNVHELWNSIFRNRIEKTLKKIVGDNLWIEDVGNLPVALINSEESRKAIILYHPLWNSDTNKPELLHPYIKATFEKMKDRSFANEEIIFLNYFDLIRRPGWCYSEIYRLYIKL